MTLRRKLGFSTVLAVVMGDMLGSGIFFTPGQLAAVVTAEWQVYAFWLLCGLITLCGALTLGELAALLPRAGVAYHALTEAYGPFAGFMQVWMLILVSGPGAIAGVAILFGELADNVLGTGDPRAILVWATGAIVFFVLVNLRGAEWGGGTQVVLTAIKVTGLAALIYGGLIIASPTPPSGGGSGAADGSLGDLVRIVGLGVAIVLFTYDGWIDASHIAGEVRNAERNFPLAMGVGVLGITLIYLLVNFAFLRVVPLDAMREAPTLVATRVAEAAFGENGGALLAAFMTLSIFGALGGLVMTLPRIYYAAASEYVGRARGTALGPAFRAVAWVSPGSSVPAGAILAGSALAILALFFFGSFSRIVTFFVVPFQFMNILMVSSIYRLRPRLGRSGFGLPGYPVLPAVFIVVMAVFLVAALVYNPVESLIGTGLTLAGIPVYRVLTRRDGLAAEEAR
ncbi:MAG: amino acid permease [Woeseia sp.]